MKSISHLCLWLVSLLSANAQNSSAVNWGPLSLTSCSGKPCVAKSFLNSLIVLAALVVVTGITLCHLECTSAAIRIIVSKHVPQTLREYIAMGVPATPMHEARQFWDYSGSVDILCTLWLLP